MYVRANEVLIIYEWTAFTSGIHSCEMFIMAGSHYRPYDTADLFPHTCTTVVHNGRIRSHPEVWVDDVV